MIIYKITNIKNGKIYIGQTSRSLKSRWRGHCSSAEHNRSNNLFHNAISKYGKESFIVEIIDFANSQEELDLLEKTHIDKHESLFPNGYNLKTGGKSNNKYSDISKSKMSAAKIGKLHSDTTKKKMSESHKAMWKEDDGSLQNKRSLQSSNIWNNDEYRAKITKARKTYWKDPSNRLAASNRMKNIYSNNEQRDKISNAVKESFKRIDVVDKLKKHYKRTEKKIVDSNGVHYSSIKEAASILGISSSNIVKVLKGVYKKSKGLTFEYVEDRKQKVYLICGVSGSGKSWICEQLKDKFSYISYDNNKKASHLDLIREADKPVLYDLSVNVSTFINRNKDEFDITPIFVMGDFLTVKSQLVSRGGKVTKSLYRRWKIMKSRYNKYGTFIGSSNEVFKYLKALTENYKSVN